MPMSRWPNLAGGASRYSLAIDSKRRNDRRQHSGFIKLRLGHDFGRSYLVPDVLIGVAGARYFLPSFFGPPMIAFNVEGRHFADFSIDVGSPRASELARLLVRIRSDDRVRVYDDGAQLYRCTFEGPRTIARFASGLCHSLANGDFAIEVFHHTKPETATLIQASGELWSTAWNLAGTRQLANVAYTYFTSLPRIETEEDLRRIAMASDGKLHFQTTSNRDREEILTLPVYRGNTKDRTAPLSFVVPCGIIAPAHLLSHPSVGSNPAYFEAIGPEIVRVGVNPNATLPFSGREIRAHADDLKHFDYVVIGDAARVDGLAAPYDEEETNHVTLLERLNKVDLFQFWLANQNTDQVSDRAFEERRLKPS